MSSWRYRSTLEQMGSTKETDEVVLILSIMHGWGTYFGLEDVNFLRILPMVDEHSRLVAVVVLQDRDEIVSSDGFDTECVRACVVGSYLSQMISEFSRHLNRCRLSKLELLKMNEINGITQRENRISAVASLVYITK